MTIRTMKSLLEENRLWNFKYENFVLILASGNPALLLTVKENQRLLNLKKDHIFGFIQNAFYLFNYENNYLSLMGKMSHSTLLQLFKF